MNDTESTPRLAQKIKFYRWVIPLVLAALGIGYTLWLIVDHHALLSIQSLIAFSLLSVVGPLIAFATLNWAARGAQSLWRVEQAQARQRQHLLALNQMSESLNRELEARVQARTHELRQAKEELAQKADALTQVLAQERRIEEETRARIAGDLHDGIRQLIIGGLYEVQAARDALDQHPASIPARLAAVQDVLRRIETEMRGAIYSLRPLALDAQGLLPAIRECVARFERVAGVNCSVEINGLSKRVPPEIEVAAFRIVQESLNNVGAHARARQARVQIGFTPRELAIQVCDDGIGFDAGAIMRHTHAHLGLWGMRERAASVGGTVEISSQPGAGTQICLRMPMVGSARAARSVNSEPIHGSDSSSRR